MWDFSKPRGPKIIATDCKYSEEKLLLEYGLVENNLSAAVSEQVVAVAHSFPHPQPLISPDRRPEQSRNTHPSLHSSAPECFALAFAVNLIPMV